MRYSTRRSIRVTALWPIALVVACSLTPVPAVAPTPGAPGRSLPAPLLGEFEDDYGNRYTITATTWRQHPRTVFHVATIEPAAMYLIARNDAGNPADPERWTRIDWLPLTGMAPWDWGFCYSAYDAPSAAAAAAVQVARRDTPRTGCNGHPFSRMKRVEPEP